jgi:tryptophan-rich sensory protein
MFVIVLAADRFRAPSVAVCLNLKTPDALVTGTYGWQAWHAAQWPHHRLRVVLLFAVNAAFNVGRSAMFFAVKRSDWALIESAFLWLSVLSLVLGLWRTSRAEVPHCLR